MAKREGSRDARRSAKLLWRAHESPGRGPKPRLDLDQIVRTAMNVADSEGLHALSMRKVAEQLGVGTMSLYTYVPGKPELLELMLDQALAGANELGDGTWRERIERIAHENWWRYHRHPWLLEIPTARQALGPNLVARYDHELSALDGVGLTDVEMDAVVNLVAGHVEGAARRALESACLERDATLPGRRLDPVRFPTAMRVAATMAEEHNEAYAPEHSFEFGLIRVLDGVQALLGGRSSDG
jgi:AcrR family transcriptional regulator